MAYLMAMCTLVLRGRALPTGVTQRRLNVSQLQYFVRKSTPCKWYSTLPPTKENLEPDKTGEEQDLFNDGAVDELAPRLDDHGSEPPSQSMVENLEPDKGDETGEVETDGTKPKYMSRGKLLAAHRAREIPELKEEDLDETFVRGSGPGGQAINKTSSSVSLIHRPTGIRVQCQATRSREQNRKIARKIMLEKLDQIANPGLSKQQVQQEKERQKKRQRVKKAKKKAKLRTESESAEHREDLG